jgi:hypothetical protein
VVRSVEGSVRHRRMPCVALLALTAAVGCGGTVHTERAVGGGATDGSSNTGARATGSGGQTTAGSGGRATAASGGALGTGGAPFLGGVPPREHDAGSPCASVTFSGDPVSLDMLVLLDRSESMSCASAGGDRWAAVERGITSYLMQAPGRRIGIRYFDSEQAGDAGDAGDAGASCAPRDYQTPDVEIAALPGNTQPIVDSFGRRGPGGRRPTAAALAGALRHAAKWRDARTGGSIAVVLVTNGEPDACGTVADAASAAAAGAKNGVSTFMIDLFDTGSTCALDSKPTQTEGLDAIALAGGTRRAFAVDLLTGGEGIVAALNRVLLTTPLSCRYPLPPGPAGLTLDTKRINVEYTPLGSPDRVAVPAVPDEAACDATAGGWYVVDPGHPSAIEFCPKSCDEIDGHLGRVEIFFSCGAGPPPP